MPIFMPSTECEYIIWRYRLMNSGTVKFFDSTKGFGFIENDDGSEDVFVHFSAINSDEYRKSLNDGDKVTFEKVQDEKNPNRFRAENVTKI